MTRLAEHNRLEQAKRGQPWKRWGPYLSERQWGTVREDYSQDGSAWDYFPHDHARSRAYQWGEDGLAGISDDHQLLCFSIALWNGADPILKERLFGLTNSQGNHGEDVKEYYYYLDSTPTHSWMRYLYRYPQGEFPYEDLVRTNAGRGRNEAEYELIDTGLFDEDRYFDVFVEYAKATTDELLIQITAFNRGPDQASLHLLPTLWFRNTWSWDGPATRPSLQRVADHEGNPVIFAVHPHLGERWLVAENAASAILFTENNTNSEKIWGRTNETPWVKDAFNRFVMDRDVGALNPGEIGTKAAAYYPLEIPGGSSTTVRLRLVDRPPARRWGHLFGRDFDKVFSARQTEADAFYASIIPANVDADTANVMRQALAGMLWTKQFYFYDVGRWLKAHGASITGSPPAEGPCPRNLQWTHMLNADLMSMPDKWEYPWYAAWDLAFHTVALAMVDAEFAKGQLELMLRERYMHPNGQIPAYEWNFSDVNPPVHAWAALFAYKTERVVTGKADVQFLKRVFDKLMLNFTWWVNRKDRDGRNIFEGGFLGLDNIGVFDRSAPLPTGGYLEQADGTAWMAFFAQQMFQISLELAAHDPAYEDLAVKFFEHFIWIAASMDHVGDDNEELWDEEDGFFYDVLRRPDGQSQRLRVRSLVGLLPLCGSTVIEPGDIRRFEKLRGRMGWIIRERQELLKTIAPPEKPSESGRHLLSALDERKLRRVLVRMLDESEFLGPFGIRSVSRYHDDHPFTIDVNGQLFTVDYQPGESESGLFGGNSNWRGPVWMPVNVLIIRALVNLHAYYGDAFRIECPTGSGQMMNLFEVAGEISDRLSRTFLKDEKGRRPVFGGTQKFQEDPLWQDHILFYEYFHGDNGGPRSEPPNGLDWFDRAYDAPFRDDDARDVRKVVSACRWGRSIGMVVREAILIEYLKRLPGGATIVLLGLAAFVIGQTPVPVTDGLAYSEAEKQGH